MMPIIGVNNAEQKCPWLSKYTVLKANIILNEFNTTYSLQITIVTIFVVKNLKTITIFDSNITCEIYPHAFFAYLSQQV